MDETIKAKEGIPGIAEGFRSIQGNPFGQIASDFEPFVCQKYH